MPTITCPNCQAELEIGESQTGGTVICRRCNHEVALSASFAQGANAVAQTTSQPAALSQQSSSRGHLAELGGDTLRTGAKRAQQLLQDLKALDFRGEVLPVGGANLLSMFKDIVFVAVVLLGTIPLLIVSVTRTDAQLTLFALFFALVWGVVFKLFVLKDEGSWKWPIASLLFTGVIGIWVLLFLYDYLLPDAYLRLADSDNLVVSLVGFVFQVGVWEELLKATPVFIMVLWKRQEIRPMQLLAIGVFSGLGFAAFENMDYANRAVSESYSLTRDYGVTGLVEGVQGAMVTAMLRAVSLVFAHAVFSGIVAYFIVAAAMRGRRRAALIILGVALAALLHGLYDWLSSLQTTAAALVIGLCFTLFYSFVARLRRLGEPNQTISPNR